MWSDNETAIDLLGFKVHAELIRDVVTDSGLLPAVIGIFGDWGGGKSSIMRMLQQELSIPENNKTVCLYFNGWLFEGYEDAKTALLASILIQLAENKTVGAKLQDSVVGLLKRVKWMDAAKAGIKHIGIPLLAQHAGLPPIQFLNTLNLVPTQPGGAEQRGNDSSSDKWSKFLTDNPEDAGLLQIRQFRDDFEQMLAKTDIEHLVVLIDDLDRCLPDRIIETLEAIKLFVAVSKTAFVIGADPRIVRHAIATRYVARQLPSDQAAPQEEYDLVQDYLEKLIQIPYYLPRLSPAEIETYINLLACQKFLDDVKTQAVMEHWRKLQKNNFYAAYQQPAVKEALGLAVLPQELENQLAWSAGVSGVLTEGLKGNPRQVKRMLNAMLLRKKLATIANLPIKDDVLAKLMVLEYTFPARFRDLNNWQTIESGKPHKLKEIEAAFRNEELDEVKLPDSLKDWEITPLRRWVQLQPPLADVDLRDYFWLARDRTNSTLVGVTLISPVIRRLLDQLLAGNDGERQTAAKYVVKLEPDETQLVLQLLADELARHPERPNAAVAFENLGALGVEGAGEYFVSGAAKASPAKLLPGTAYKLAALGKGSSLLAGSIYDLLNELAQSKSPAGGAAKKIVSQWRKEA